MIGSLQPLNGEERIVADFGDTLRLRQSRLAPDFRRVTGISELLEALRQAPLLGLKRWQIDRRSMLDERKSTISKTVEAFGRYQRLGSRKPTHDPRLPTYDQEFRSTRLNSFVKPRLDRELVER
jgi:hypothetical protein